MAFCLSSLISVSVLLGIAFVLRRRLAQISIVIRSPSRSREVIDNGGNVISSGNEKSPVVQAGKPYHMTMGLKRLDLFNWLTVDSEYMKEHAIRKELLDNSSTAVLQCLPGSEVACEETMKLVASFLVSRYPDMFVVDSNDHTTPIYNKATGESFSLLCGPNSPNPLEVAARLAMEDFNILMKDPNDQQYHLMASATLFPVGWKLQERIGGSMATLHKPVPKWQEKLGCPIDRYFDRLSPTSTMERRNTFIQIGHKLHQTSPSPSTASPKSILIPPSEIILRCERQTFRRLPQSQAVLFTVHTFMNPITSLSDEELRDFVDQMRGWPEETGKYKGKEYWGPAVERYVLERFGGEGAPEERV